MANVQDGYGIGYGNTAVKKTYTDKNAEINRTMSVLQNRTTQGLDNSAQLSHYKNLTGQDYKSTPAPAAIASPQAPQWDQNAYLQQRQGQVNSIYDQQKAAQMAQFNAERDKAMGLINQQKAKVAPEYANKRNQADVVNAQNVSKLREMMAANGISASGENVTANVALGSARQGALSSLNLQELETNNDFNRQITDVNNPDRLNAMIAQLEAQRSQALYDASNRADDVGYSRGRDSIMDGRYADETQYGRGQDSKQWDYQTGRDSVADKHYDQQFGYQAGRDKVGDSQWQKQYEYQKGRDGVGDSQWDKQFNAGRTDVANDQAWRTYQYNNMSASDKAQMAQNASQFGEEMAWRMYSQEYQGELDKSMSNAQLEAYRNGNFKGAVADNWSLSSLPPNQRGVWNGKITSDYGMRTHPVTGQKGTFHNGTDIASPNGTNIPANVSGKVIASGDAKKFGYSETYGNIVVVRDAKGNDHLYAHMSKALAKVGSTVGAGSNLGLVGSTGRSTGNHVHYSVKNKGKTINPKQFMG